MDLNLNGRNALVCGSSQGIGYESALAIASLGATVILMARDEKALLSAVAKLPADHGQKHSYIVADFFSKEQVADGINNFLKLGNPIHILVNNTGGPKGGAIADADTKAFIEAFQMHVVNYQILLQAILPGMKAGQFGRIVNIISTSVKQPIVGLGVSNTVRGAVANWSKTMSLELGEFGITSNNVLPGYTRTARLDAMLKMQSENSGRSMEQVSEELQASIPIKRFCEPAEVASAVAFLCSPAASAISGINLPVDGGRTGSL